jgi:hypothetical protein
MRFELKLNEKWIRNAVRIMLFTLIYPVVNFLTIALIMLYLEFPLWLFFQLVSINYVVSPLTVYVIDFIKALEVTDVLFFSLLLGIFASYVIDGGIVIIRRKEQ